MKNGAWRSSRHLIYGLLGALISLPETAWADTDAGFVSYYQQAYVQGRDLVPASPKPLDTASIATRLDLQSVSPEAALSGSAFLAADGTIIKLAGVQGCLSTEPLEFSGVMATCAMISLAAMTATIGEILKVDLERPRGRLELAHDPRYVEYRAQVLSFLYEKQAHVEKQAA